MSTLEIRAALPADVPLIREFITDLADYEKLRHEVKATDERLTATLFPADGRPAAECALAWSDGRAIGFAIHFPTYSTFLAQPGIHLEDLFVKPAYRGKGVGRAILTYLAREASRRGCGRLEWTVLDWNESAIAFYESFGARRLREWQICRLDGAALARYALLP